MKQNDKVLVAIVVATCFLTLIRSNPINIDSIKNREQVESAESSIGDMSPPPVSFNEDVISFFSYSAELYDLLSNSALISNTPETKVVHPNDNNPFLNLPHELFLHITRELGTRDILKLGATSKRMRSDHLDFLLADARKLVETMWIRRHLTGSNKTISDTRLTAAIAPIRNPERLVKIMSEIDLYTKKERISSFEVFDENKNPFEAFRNVLRMEPILSVLGESFQVYPDLKLRFAYHFLNIYGEDREMIQVLGANPAMNDSFAISDSTVHFNNIYYQLLETFASSTTLKWKTYVFMLSITNSSFYLNIQRLLYNTDKLRTILHHELKLNGFILFEDYLIILQVPNSILKDNSLLIDVLFDEDLTCSIMEVSKINAHQLGQLAEHWKCLKQSMNQVEERFTRILQRVKLNDILNRNPNFDAFANIISLYTELSPFLYELLFDENLVLRALQVAQMGDAEMYFNIATDHGNPNGIIEKYLTHPKYFQMIVANTKSFNLYDFNNFLQKIMQHTPSLAEVIITGELIANVLDRGCILPMALTSLFEMIIRYHPNALQLLEQVFTPERSIRILDFFSNNTISFLKELLSCDVLPSHLFHQLFSFERMKKALIGLPLDYFVAIIHDFEERRNPNHIIENVFQDVEILERVLDSKDAHSEPSIREYLELAHFFLKYSRNTGELSRYLFTENRLLRIRLCLAIAPTRFLNKKAVSFMRLIHYYGVPISTIENAFFYSLKVSNASRHLQDFLDYAQLAKDIGISREAVETFLLMNEDFLGNSLRSIDSKRITSEDVHLFLELAAVLKELDNPGNILDLFYEEAIYSKFSSKFMEHESDSSPVLINWI